jgi:RND superfamily putative drug exporter
MGLAIGGGHQPADPRVQRLSPQSADHAARSLAQRHTGGEMDAAAKVLGPLAGKLTGAEKNDAQAWLPGSAESTKVLALQSRFQSPNIFTAVVVYDRPTGLTGADRAKAAADARAFAAVPGVVTSQLAGPITSGDGKAIETIVPVNLGQKGWNGAEAAATKLRTIVDANANGLASHITGPLGNAADSANAFKGIDSTLLYATLAVVIVLLLVTYRSPVRR